MAEPNAQVILDEIVARLREALSPAAIYVYGSWIYGTPHRDSDLDILVIVPTSDLSFFDRSAVAYKALRGIDMPIDLQVYTADEFAERAALPVSFERTVKTKGHLLYAA